ncbi:MAG: S-methyl-5-thioribose-1-phosphate isomerase [Planctomycetota bacterium]|nr:S-methyl-5-thioribose-1-phosphate isomerase [Planctomycetota bacterium]
MRVKQNHYRTVWMDRQSVFMIDQNLLPFQFEIFESKTYKESCAAIRNMTVRGAGAIGAAAAFSMAQVILSAPEQNFWAYAEEGRKEIENTRPTAQNLFYAVDRVLGAARKSQVPKKAALEEAQSVADEDVRSCQAIGETGATLIKDNARIQTHCNAGWLAFVDYGTALSPIYAAAKAGKKVFVYVDETRPRSQGARLTAWELYHQDIPHAIVPDNAGAYLMSIGKVDLMIVGADRIAANGDTANKIGTLEKAIAAKEFGVPFYVAAPRSTFDLNCNDKDGIPIEQRDEEEVLYQIGLTQSGKIEKVLVASPGSKAVNPAFDVTPAKYITGIITEKGIVTPSRASIARLFGR